MSTKKSIPWASRMTPVQMMLPILHVFAAICFPQTDAKTEKKIQMLQDQNAALKKQVQEEQARAKQLKDDVKEAKQAGAGDVSSLPLNLANTWISFLHSSFIPSFIASFLLPFRGFWVISLLLLTLGNLKMLFLLFLSNLVVVFLLSYHPSFLFLPSLSVHASWLHSSFFYSFLQIFYSALKYEK